MSLGLVAYDDSDESENETDIGADTKTNISLTSNVLSPFYDTKSAEKDLLPEHNKEQITVISDKEAEITEDLILQPKLQIPESRVLLLNTDIDVKCLTRGSKKNGPVKITIPSFNEIDLEAEEPSKKKIKPSKKGSGLFALLPDPKGSLIPQSVVNKKKNPSINKQNTVTNKVSKQITKAQVKSTPLTSYEDSGDEEDSSGTDFFSLDSKDNVVPEPIEVNIDLSNNEVCQHEKVPQKVNDDALQFNEGLQYTPWQVGPNSVPSNSVAQQSPSEYPTEEFMTFSNTDLKLNQEAMQQLCGKRDRLKMQEVNLIDVSGDAIMPDSREWLTKQMTEEQAHRPSHKKRDGPTSQQKRKHQITYLAYQAKENELELKNQWANNRMSRKQTQAKYGF